MYSNTCSENPKFGALSEILKLNLWCICTRGRHNWIGSDKSIRSYFLRELPIRSNFFEKVTDPILFSREGHRSSPFFSKTDQIGWNYIVSSYEVVIFGIKIDCIIERTITIISIINFKSFGDFKKISKKCHCKT